MLKTVTWLDKMAKSFTCISCSEKSFCNPLVIECGHQYCHQCLAKIINESLSLLNQIPKCIYPDCNQLTTRRPRHLVSRKYKPKHSFIQSESLLLLLHGYVSKSYMIPDDIILLIFNYCYLIYDIEVTCDNCCGSGKQFDCYTRCDTCNNVLYDIFKYKCWSCGEGKRIKFLKVVQCRRCWGDGTIMRLDFKKICNNQSLCIKCNTYSLNDRIFYWTECKHIYCAQCFTKLRVIKDNFKTFPKCIASECYQALDKMRTVFECTKCESYHMYKDLFLWSVCEHPYSKMCAKECVDLQFKPSEFKLIDIFKQIPKCCHANCNEKIKEKEAKSIGVTKFEKESSWNVF